MASYRVKIRRDIEDEWLVDAESEDEAIDKAVEEDGMWQDSFLWDVAYKVEKEDD